VLLSFISVPVSADSPFDCDSEPRLVFHPADAFIIAEIGVLLLLALFIIFKMEKAFKNIKFQISEKKILIIKNTSLIFLLGLLGYISMKHFISIELYSPCSEMNK
jgi:hydrogenase-4 membrane subunit HyfE